MAAAAAMRARKSARDRNVLIGNLPRVESECYRALPVPAFGKGP
jgi:hypothetical protein